MNRRVCAVVEPDGERLSVEQPVWVQLGDAGKDVDQAQLASQEPQDGYRNGGRRARGWRSAGCQKGIKGGGARHRQEDHDETEQADQVVVVEVGRLVNELDIGEEQKEGGDGQPIAVPQRDAKAGQAEHAEVQVHPPRGPRLHPSEAGIGEVVGRLDVHIGDPTVGDEPHHRGETDEAEDDAKGGRRSRRDRLASRKHYPVDEVQVELRRLLLWRLAARPQQLEKTRPLHVTASCRRPCQ